jgi:hypothetical protein
MHKYTLENSESNSLTGSNKIALFSLASAQWHNAGLF